MRGTIDFRKDRGYYRVLWSHSDGKRYKIYRYNGELLYNIKVAEKLLACMQADVEKGIFRIERYTKEVPTDIIPYLEEWLTGQEKRVPESLSPATYKDYRNSIYKHLIPWFTKNPYQLHELQYDILCKLLTGIKRSGKGKRNVMYCLHSCLLVAQKSNRIVAVPPFPEKTKYGLVEPTITTVSEDRQIKIIEAIPKELQPIFWWLKYHYRRPSEAMALYKTDYDSERDVFTIQRAFSSKQLVPYTKTRKKHVIPCHPDFKKFMKEMSIMFSPFFFTNPYGKLKGKHFQHDFLVDTWKKACEKVDEQIPLYAGTKHSSCTIAVNEKGLSIDELQMLTDHARRDSVLKYTDVQIRKKRELMEKTRKGQVIDFSDVEYRK